MYNSRLPLVLDDFRHELREIRSARKHLTVPTPCRGAIGQSADSYEAQKQMYRLSPAVPGTDIFRLVLSTAVGLCVTAGCQNKDAIEVDYSGPMQVWTVHGVQVHDQMTLDEVSTLMGASLEEVVTIRSNHPLRGKGSTYIHSCRGHAFYFFKKDATSSDTTTQPKILTGIAVGEGAGGEELKPTGGWLHQEPKQESPSVLTIRRADPVS